MKYTILWQNKFFKEKKKKTQNSNTVDAILQSLDTQKMGHQCHIICSIHWY